MDHSAECSRGWGARCAASHGKRCRCACGGHNHGGIVRAAIRSAHANFRVERNDDRAVIIRDLGPWDRHPTVTNDAEWVVGELASLVGPRPLLYYDSMGNLDQLLIRDGRFCGFAPGSNCNAVGV